MCVICIDIVLNSCKGRMVNSVHVIRIDIVLNSCKGKMVHSGLLQYAEHVSDIFLYSACVGKAAQLGLRLSSRFYLPR